MRYASRYIICRQIFGAQSFTISISITKSSAVISSESVIGIIACILSSLNPSEGSDIADAYYCSSIFILTIDYYDNVPRVKP